MYAFIRGRVDEVRENGAVLDAGGVGYLLLAPVSTLSRLNAGTEAKLYTVLCVREDDLSLYGFYTSEERSMFEKLRAVSGIGPKLALAALSSMSVNALAVALATEDYASLSKVPGVGRKIAQRMVLELKEKMNARGAVAPEKGATASSVAQGPAGQALQALLALGYPASDAQAAIERVLGRSEKVEELVFLALQQIDAGGR